MWFSFWRSRDRFSIDQLRYLTDQLQKIQVVNEVNKGFVIEALRAISELVTYGDQHDSTFFEFFMEKQIMDEFIRLLEISTVTTVAIQILQTMSIMIQNLRNEHAIYYMFSNEHINSLIKYPFDFQNEELLSYYISFLRAISGKLDKNTISLFVKTQNEEVISFPLYVEAVRFAFHEENMVRIAVRALTLNIYHVGDEHVNKYISSSPLSDYFADLITHFQKKCKILDDYVSQTSKKPDPGDSVLSIVTAVDEIEDSLYYFSDVISAGVSELVQLISNNILQLLVFPLLLPSLTEQDFGSKISVVTSLYLLSCILRTVKTKDLAGSIAAALFCLPECFINISEAKLNGWVSNHSLSYVQQHQNADSVSAKVEKGFEESQPTSYSPSAKRNGCQSQTSLRGLMLSYIKGGNDIQSLGSLDLLSTLLQTKELDESMLEGFGILPQRQQQKKLLLQALVGEGSGEEQLFFSGSSSGKDSGTTELDNFLQKIKDQYGLFFCCEKYGISAQLHRCQVLDALVSLFCRSTASSEVLWSGGWLFKQLLPHNETDFGNHRLHELKVSLECSRTNLFEEANGRWCDLLVTVLLREWTNCRKAIESPSPQKDLKRILFPLRRYSIEGDSSSAAAERMCEMVKVFILLHLLLMLISKGTLVDPPAVDSSFSSTNDGATVIGSDVQPLKPGMEISLGDALPCRIAFERGKECHFSFLAITRGTFGWVLLADELPHKPQHGIIRVVAPLAGSNPRMDEKHRKWLHLRIRPSSLPSVELSKTTTLWKGKTKALVDGRWTLAFQNEEACLSAETMVTQQMSQQRTAVETRLKTLLDASN